MSTWLSLRNFNYVYTYSRGLKPRFLVSRGPSAFFGKESMSIKSSTAQSPTLADDKDAPVNSYARKALLASNLGYAMDGFDLMILSFMLPAVTVGLALSSSEAGSLITWTLIGAVIGGLIVGALSDRFGRIRVLSWTILLFGVFTGLCAIAQGYWDLLIYRTIAGIGLGGEFGIGVRTACREHMDAKSLTFSFASSGTPEADAAAKRLSRRYGQMPFGQADIVVALGGDGFLLQTLRETMSTGKRVYGMNRGTVGFLMNEYSEDALPGRLAAAVAETIRPLEMETIDDTGAATQALAINEVSLLRQSYQAARLRISVDGKVRLEDLICDGVMVATPAGSTAYNLSAHGPILPLDAPLLALTPVSPFRPRRWRGALLPKTAVVRFEILEERKRPVNAVADHTEVKSVVSVEVKESASHTATLLFDAGHSWSERILAEQFKY